MIAALRSTKVLDQFGLAQKGSHFALQQLPTDEHLLVAHRRVLAGVDPIFHAIQLPMAPAPQPCLLTDLVQQDELTGQCVEVMAAEVAVAAEGRLLVARCNPKRCVLPAGLLDPAPPGQPDAIAVQEQHHHHPRPIHLLTAGILLAGVSGDLDLIQLGGKIQQEQQQVVPLQQVHWRGRQQQHLLRIPGCGRSCSCATVSARSTAVKRFWADLAAVDLGLGAALCAIGS